MLQTTIRIWTMAILRWPNEALRQLIEEKDANCFDPRVGNFLDGKQQLSRRNYSLIAKVVFHYQYEYKSQRGKIVGYKEVLVRQLFI